MDLISFNAPVTGMSPVLGCHPAATKGEQCRAEPNGSCGEDDSDRHDFGRFLSDGKCPED